MSMNAEAAGVHENESKLALPQPLGGLLSLALLLLISQAVWYGLFSPAGPVSLYTPNVGLSLVITILMVIHWGIDVFNFWPFSRSFLSGTNPLAKGAILLMVYVGVAAVMMFGIYYNVIGRFGPIFFSGPQLIASGGLGQYSQTAIENGCYAQIMMNTCIIFFTILWVRSFGFSPWQQNSALTKSFSVWLTGMFLAILAFSVLFYPHIAYQFYPPQTFMAALPWWSDVAMTQSSLFHFGWIVPSLVLLYWTKMLWEGRPFSLITTGWLRGIVTMATVIAAGVILMFVGNWIMNWYFGGEAFMGGNTTEQPAWRWNHVAEMAMFMQTAAVILYYYFDNWPSKLSLPARAVIRTIIAVAGGLIIAKMYYVLGPTFLGTVQGIGQDNDTSLCWTVMVLILIVAHAEFFDGFPFKKRIKA
jgi:amino acid transporter, AAT family